MEKRQVQEERKLWGWLGWLEQRPLGLLGLGVLFLALAHTRWNVPWLVWIAPVPLLGYLRLTSGWRSRLWVGLSLWLGWTLAVMKLTTAPMPALVALAFSTPIALFLLPGYLGWSWLQSRVSPVAASISFAALSVVGEWLQHRLTALGSWGAAAYTQVNQLELLQILSLFGMAGLSFLLYWTAAVLEEVWASRGQRLAQLMVLVVVLALVWTYGALRLSWSGEQTQTTVRMAAVSTDTTFSPSSLPSPKQLKRINQTLFARTEQAARSGARMVVWNEGATFAWPKEDKAWQTSLQALARKLKIELIAAYIVPVRTQPMLYENKYVWIRPAGQLEQIYFKHEPVLGEPAIKGKKPHRAVQTTFGKVAGAICYDYDYPALARVHGKLNVGLVAVPSSDWIGIHGYHTQMAMYRAIENGFSLLRSTRLGLSAGYDAYGRLYAQQSFFNRTDRVMMVELPVRSVPTFYRWMGDLVVWLAWLWIGVVLALAIRSRNT